MVKNISGGKFAKRMGSKYIVDSGRQRDLRLVMNKEDGEMYACVTKIFGGRMCSVIGIDGKEYMCHIRQKFSGKSKRDNLVALGSWVIVGLRLWESTKRSCDLLEVYSPHEIDLLKKTVAENWHVFPSFDFSSSSPGGGGMGGGDDVCFSETQEDIMEEDVKPGVDDIAEHVAFFENEHINIDDI